MSMPNSVEEIDAGMIAEGIDDMDGLSKMFYEMRLDMMKNCVGKTYNLDHCGDGPEYCRECCQPECGKRMN